MLGAQESYLNQLKHGSWQGFSSSLDQFDEVTPNIIRQQMVAADKMTESILNVLELQAALKDGKPADKVVMQMIKHEMHHHGQLVNYMFCHQLPIPSSWNQVWALAYED